MIDLHCDLLSYLAVDSKRTPYDPGSRCSFPQMEQGGLTLQVLAAYVETGPGSSVFGRRQIDIFKILKHPTIEFRLAIENASGLFEESEPLQWPEALPPLQYMSLTWNPENRFGGGTLSSTGLKPDGKWLLREMNDRGIAVDLSHASDALAEDILNEIDKCGYVLPIIASHSNARAICDHPRNLPDHLIREIVDRKGLIGLNLYRKFLGGCFPDTLQSHIYYFRKLGAESCLVWGADFFYAEDLPQEYQQPEEDLYFQDASNASCYPKLGALLEEDFRRKIDKENFELWSVAALLR